MLNVLKEPIVWAASGSLKTLGSAAGVDDAVVTRCLSRMRVWIHLLEGVMDAEFPSYEIQQA